MSGWEVSSGGGVGSSRGVQGRRARAHHLGHRARLPLRRGGREDGRGHQKGGEALNQREDGAILGLLVGAIIGGLLWVVIIAAVRWVLQLPPPALARLVGVTLLFAGTGIVFAGIVRLHFVSGKGRAFGTASRSRHPAGSQPVTESRPSLRARERSCGAGIEPTGAAKPALLHPQPVTGESRKRRPENPGAPEHGRNAGERRLTRRGSRRDGTARSAIRKDSLRKEGDQAQHASTLQNSGRMGVVGAGSSLSRQGPALFARRS